MTKRYIKQTEYTLRNDINRDYIEWVLFRVGKANDADYILEKYSEDTLLTKMTKKDQKYLLKEIIESFFKKGWLDQPSIDTLFEEQSSECIIGGLAIKQRSGFAKKATGTTITIKKIN